MAWRCYYVHYVDAAGNVLCVGVFGNSPQDAVDRFRVDMPWDVKVVKVTVETKGCWE